MPHGNNNLGCFIRLERPAAKIMTAKEFFGGFRLGRRFIVAMVQRGCNKTKAGASSTHFIRFASFEPIRLAGMGGSFRTVKRRECRAPMMQRVACEETLV